jgi:ribonuclease HI
VDTVIVYTDGACDPNPGPGGWGAILLFGEHKKTLSGGANSSTNNRMELTAVIEALGALKRRVHVRLHTDSTYVQRGVTEHLVRWKANGWRTSDKKDVANRDLWEALDTALTRYDVEWIWVKGHAGDPFNEEVDRLAVAATPKAERPAAEAGTIHVYTGASCLGNSGPGGWAAVIQDGDELAEISGHEPVCSANEMHLLAIERGLSLIEPGTGVHIHTPSDYAAQADQGRGRGQQPGSMEGDPDPNAGLAGHLAQSQGCPAQPALPARRCPGAGGGAQVNIKQSGISQIYPKEGFGIYGKGVQWGGRYLPRCTPFITSAAPATPLFSLDGNRGWGPPARPPGWGSGRSHPPAPAVAPQASDSHRHTPRPAPPRRPDHSETRHC